ncbi:biotin/lipoyl-containing protein [Pectinatus haikarae]|uniref:biotin/lipoyl-containing protein n=1 Tax=Pectinatus haikarae TaxID=349096 RepID=UPI0018C5CB8B
MKKFNVTVNGNSYEVEIEEVKGAAVPAASVPKAAPAAPVVSAPKAAPAAPAAVPAGGTTIAAPMPGKITKVIAAVGQAVNAGDVVLILEAMKMQNEITAPAAGTVKAVNVEVGKSVKAGEAMVVLG